MMEAAKVGWGTSGVEASPEGSGDVKRLRCWLFNLAAGVSLVFCLATLALWVWSYRGGRSIERVDPDRRIVVTSMRGLITATRWDGRFEPSIAAEFEDNRAPRATWGRWFYWRGMVEEDPAPYNFAYYPSCGVEHWWQRLGFDAADKQLKPRPGSIALHDWLQPVWSGRERSLTIPHWALTVAFAALPARGLLSFRRRLQRRRAGLCRACGYDLRATPDRCPECGTVPEAAKGVAG
jgi:hypothetical protein